MSIDHPGAAEETQRSPVLHEVKGVKFYIQPISEEMKEPLLQAVATAWDPIALDELRDTLGHYFEQKASANPSLLNVEYYVATNVNGQPFAITGIYTIDIQGGAGFATKKIMDPTNHHFAAGLGWFSVSKEYQGSGIGGYLLDWTENLARELGATYMMIETDDAPNELAALRLYEKKGYMPGFSIPDYFGPGRNLVNYFRKVSLREEVTVDSSQYEQVTRENVLEVQSLASKIYSGARLKEFQACLDLFLKQPKDSAGIQRPKSFVLRSPDGDIVAFALMTEGIYENALNVYWYGVDPKVSNSWQRMKDGIENFAAASSRKIIYLSSEGQNPNLEKQGFEKVPPTGIRGFFEEESPYSLLMYFKRLIPPAARLDKKRVFAYTQVMNTQPQQEIPGQPAASSAISEEMAHIERFLEEKQTRGEIDEFEYGKIVREVRRQWENYTRRKKPQDHMFLSPEVLESSPVAREVQNALDEIYLNKNQARVETVTEERDANLLGGWQLFNSCFDPEEMDSLKDTREYVTASKEGTGTPYIMQVVNTTGPRGSQVVAAISGSVFETEEGSFGAIGYLATKDDLHDREKIGATVTPLRKSRQYGTILASQFTEECGRQAEEKGVANLGILLEARSGSERFWIEKYGARYVCIRTPEGGVSRVNYLCPSLDPSVSEPVPEKLAFRPSDHGMKEMPKESLLAMVRALMEDWYEEGINMPKILADFERSVREAPGETVILLDEPELTQMQTRQAARSTLSM